MTVIIGIDPHKASHTATAICAGLAEAGTIRVRAARSMCDQLLGWAQQWPERRWAIEGARGLGQLLAQQLVAAGEDVVDVPATLSARVRTLETGHGRKTDRIDARAVAIVAAQRPDLPRVGADDHRRVLRLLADRRDELTRERRRTLNRLHRHLRDLVPGGAPVHLSADTAAGLLAKIRPRDSVEAERKQMARDLLADLRRLDKATAHNRRRCADAVAASGTTLTLWVPIIRSWALTWGFALLSGTRNRYEIWYMRTQHRPPSRQVNDHGRVSGTRTVSGRVVHGSASTARVSPTLI